MNNESRTADVAAARDTLIRMGARAREHELYNRMRSKGRRRDPKGVLSDLIALADPPHAESRDARD